MSDAHGCLQFEIGARTDIGRVRHNNEDACLVLPALNLFVISDGMGGESAGEVASTMVTEAIARYCSEPGNAKAAEGDFRLPEYSEKTNRLSESVRLANRKIYNAAQADPLLRGMGATVVVVWIDGLRLCLVNVGDSRAYLFRSGRLQLVTSDHTLVAEQVRRGLIRPEDAHRSKMQNILIRALGVYEEVEIDAAEHALMDHDAILLCSDGLTRMVSDSEIGEALAACSDAQTCADHLVSVANASGGDDNVSVIVLRIAGGS